MSKLSPEDKFLDFSDYARPLGKFLANQLKSTGLTPIHVTYMFGMSGLCAIYCMFTNHMMAAGFFLILKSGIDAADGELARVKSTPSYSGRYLDSIFDIVLNFLFVLTIFFVTKSDFWIAILAFVAIQLQGTLYNYYYVIVRTQLAGGDSTSKIFESKAPLAFPTESQRVVNVLFWIFNVLYSFFDKTIFLLDSSAIKVKHYPRWFLTFMSIFGLGFQLLVMAVMLGVGWVSFVLPFFILYSIFLGVIILTRKYFIK